MVPNRPAMLRALLLAKQIAAKTDPGFAGVSIPIPGEPIPLARAAGGQVDDTNYLNSMGLYSQASKAAENLTPKQSSGSAQDMLNIISKSPGVKKDELQWSGVQNKFAGQSGITKDDLAHHLHIRMPQILETTHKAEEPSEDNDWSTTKGAQYGDYTIPGGNNYREVLMHLPKNDVTISDVEREMGFIRPLTNEQQDQVIAKWRGRGPEANYNSSHWRGTPNVVAHLRMSDRNTPEGEKALHLEELQSDWGQDARKKGIAGTGPAPTIKNEGGIWKIRNANGERIDLNGTVGYATEDQARSALASAGHVDDGGVPNAPYINKTENWTDLGLKRALIEAARGGYDKLVYTPGEEQARRYNLSKHIARVDYEHDPRLNTHDVVAYDPHGVPIANHYDTKPEDLEQHLGKDIAQKILNGEGRLVESNERNDLDSRIDTKRLTGLDTKLGGEGMKGYYDKLLPERLLKLAREHDPEAQLGQHVVEKRNEGDHMTLPGLTITPRMREGILKRGFKAFADGGEVEPTAYADGGAVNPDARGGAVDGDGDDIFPETGSIYNTPDSYAGGGMVMDPQKAIRRAMMTVRALHRSTGGRTDPANISFEAVPGENYDPAMKQRMQALPEHHISDITTALQGEFMPHIMRATKAQGQIMPQLGGWMGDTNPSRVIQVNDPSKASLVAHLAGHVFRQDGMMHVSDTPHEGSVPHGATRILLPKGTTSKDVASIYKKIYDHMGPDAASGHSTNLSEGVMDIIHNPDDSKLTPKEHAIKIDKLLGPNYDTTSQEAHVSFPGSGDYTNGVSGAYKSRGFTALSSEGVADHLQAKAKERLESYITAAEAQVDKKGRLRLPTVFPHEAGPLSVSTRLPTNKGAIEAGVVPVPGTPHQLQTDSASQRQAISDHNALLANNTHPGLKHTDDPDEAREAYLDLSKRNLLAVHDRFSPEAKATSAGWYWAAHHVGNAIANDHNLPKQAGHAILAVLSPQNPWDNNVSMAERVTDALANGQNHPWTQEMDEHAARIFKMPKDAKNLAAIRGKTLGELRSNTNDHTLQAMWIRAFDEAHNTKQYKSIDPSGQFTTTNKRPLQWFSTGPIAKAVSIFHDPSIQNISDQLGEKNKVRSFYENISDPDGPNSVTADTHAVAAAQGRPLGASSFPVNQNFGTSPEKKHQTPDWRSARNDAETGLHGTYGLTADATRLAAHERGILPRQMQSITWEGVRNLFEGKKGKNYHGLIDAIWHRYRDGELSHHQVWDEIERVMGGFRKPSWAAAGEPTGPGERKSYSGPLANPSNPKSIRKPPTEFSNGGAIDRALKIAAKYRR